MDDHKYQRVESYIKRYSTKKKKNRKDKYQPIVHDIDYY